MCEKLRVGSIKSQIENKNIAAADTVVADQQTADVNDNIEQGLEGFALPGRLVCASVFTVHLLRCDLNEQPPVRAAEVSPVLFASLARIRQLGSQLRIGWIGFCLLRATAIYQLP